MKIGSAAAVRAALCVLLAVAAARCDGDGGGGPGAGGADAAGAADTAPRADGESPADAAAADTAPADGEGPGDAAAAPDGRGERGDSQPPGGPLDVAVCDPAAGPFTLAIDNPYLPLAIGSRLVLEGLDEGALLRVEVTVLDETEVVAGVTTRVVEERETEDDELSEVSRNFFAQAPDGTVCYFGEDVDVYGGGAVVSHRGSWRAGVAGARPGIRMPPDPAVGMTFQQEVAEGVAEDSGEIVAVGASVTVPFGTFADTVHVVESSPLDAGTSLKVYARGVGLIVDAALELVLRMGP